MISIYCQEPSHAERRWDIRTFKRINNGWVAMPSSFSGHRKKLLGEAKTMIRREGEQYLPHPQRPGPRRESQPDVEGFRRANAIRRSPHLKCKLCKLAFARTDTTVLFAVLDRCERAGLEQVSLRTLINDAANISNSTE